MVEVFDKIFVGDDNDYEAKRRDYNFSYLHCAKHPYHKNIVGYSENPNPTDAQYLYAHQNGVLALNMVDAKEEKYFSIPMFQYAVLFIRSEVAKGKSVLINCNKGESRSPSVALIYLAQMGVVRNDSYTNAKEDFLKIYPKYNPAFGVASFLMTRWNGLVEEIKFAK